MRPRSLHQGVRASAQDQALLQRCLPRPGEPRAKRSAAKCGCRAPAAGGAGVPERHPARLGSALAAPRLLPGRRGLRDCGGSLTASPRGTLRICPACQVRVIPAGVSSPYAREDNLRQVRSQRELDLAAIALAQRRGVMTSQLEQIAADPQLHPGSGAGRRVVPRAGT